MIGQGVWAASQDPSVATISSSVAEAGAIHLVTILYKSERSLASFLDDLQAQDLKDWHLHVIDNASPDNSRRVVEKRADPRILVIKNEKNLGFAKAANQGLCAAIAAGGAFFILINNDTAFSPDFLGRLVAVKAELPARVIAPRVMLREQPDKAWYAGGRLDNRWIFRNIHNEYNAADSSATIEVGFAPGCCLGIGRDVLWQVGFLDESFFVYWEDTDFCIRLKSNGIKAFYAPELFLLHSGGESSGGEHSPAYMRLFYRSYMQIIRKHFGLAGALRTMARLLLCESGRANRNLRVIARMARAMTLGLVSPLVPQVRLNESVHPR